VKRSREKASTTYCCLQPSSQYICREGNSTIPIKMCTAINNHTSSGVVAHPAGASLDVAYRLVLVAMVEMSEGVRKHCRAVAQLSARMRKKSEGEEE
jgi:hypothetical protein